MSKREKITSDERFKNIHNDPRFKLPKRNDFKVELDDRFKNSDLTAIKRKAKIDKYGRKVTDKQNTFDKYFKSENKDKSEEDVEESEESENESDSESEDQLKPKVPKTLEESESESESESDSGSNSSDIAEVLDNEKFNSLDRSRGDNIRSDAESSSDESSSDESSSEEESDEEEENFEDDDKPEETDPSKRLAVVNLDWDHVKSVDLMATFQSFVPSDGLIESISIYPSEFGKERMQKEDIEGPPRDLFKKKSKKSKKVDDEGSDSDSEIEAKDLYEEGDGTTDYDSKSLRRYQLQRLRYYYAVISCDSIKTAKNIYDNCDGTEYESTANMFDLRFIPDEVEFTDDKPRDTCSKIPSNYKPETFVTDALQHSKVKLTWDETPTERVKLSAKAFSQRELDDMDFKAYLASDNSDDDGQEESNDLKNKYKNLVSASTKIGNRDIFNTDDKEDIDMEITFTPGLDASADGEAKGEEKEDESTIDKLKRKTKERRKARKDKLKELKQQEIDEKKASTAESKKTKNKDDESKSKAELELLMLEEDNKQASQHFNLKELVRSEKEKGKKNKHKNKDKIIEDDFNADLNDPRFNEIFTNHEFAIDPTQPQFKKTSTMNKIMEERNKRRDDEENPSNKSENKKNKKRKHEQTESSGGDVNSLVQKLKRKAKK